MYVLCALSGGRVGRIEHIYFGVWDTNVMYRLLEEKEGAHMYAALKI
jgi:hypothetical protein